MRRNDPTDWSALRLNDRVRSGVRVLFVGINPGVRSAVTGHHFAGPSNRFWKLLFESGLVSEPVGYEDDDRLPEWGYGITNLIARPTPGINDLRPAEYAEGWNVLARKVRRYRPQILALVGVTVYRALLPRLKGAENASAKERVELGSQQEVVHGARLFVLPNPSGRNANFTYAQMLSAFRALKEELAQSAEHPASSRAQRVSARPSRQKQVRTVTAGSDR